MVINKLFLFIMISFMGLFANAVRAETCTVQLALTGTIGPASLDFIQRGQKMAQSRGCQSLLILINTPGGSLQSTRLIVEEILNSPRPILCLIHPSGGHAGSAGAIIMQACHVNGAVEGTNIGAATPVASGGAEIPKDLREKILNDTLSLMDSLTKIRGRNQQFGQDIVRHAKAVSAPEAQRLGAIDTLTSDVEQFLRFAQGRSVVLANSQKSKVETGLVHVLNIDLRQKVLELLTDPEIAYLLLMGSLALLYFEFTHPGINVAGVLGGIGLVVALMALHKLNVEWAALLLIFLGIALLIAELFLPTFGILGIGGVISFVLGGIFMFDPETSGGYRLPLYLIMPVAITLGVAMIGVGYIALKAQRRKLQTGFLAMNGELAVVSQVNNLREGHVDIQGEIWRFRSQDDVQAQDRVRVIGHEGLTLLVKKATPNQES